MASRELSGDRVELPDVRVIRQTDAALLLVYENEECWIPKSAVHDDSPVYEVGHEGDMIVARWWAVKLKLVED